MELVTILRELWRRRNVVAAVAIVAVLVAVAASYRVTGPLTLESRSYQVGLATAQILLDTPSSQVVEVAPKGSDTLGVRANLLASLMVQGDVKSAIADRAGIPATKLHGIAESAVVENADKKPGPRDSVLTTRVVSTSDGDRIPIIEIEAQAPDAQRAAALADAAVAGLRDYINSKAAGEAVVDTKRLHVSSLGKAQARGMTRGPSLLIALALALLVFVAGCAAILVITAVVRGWSAAARADEWDADDFDPGFENTHLSSDEERFGQEDRVDDDADSYMPVHSRSGAARMEPTVHTVRTSYES